jgi:transketolase
MSSIGDGALAERASSIRRRAIRMCRGRGQGYVGQALALADLMACLYFDELRRDESGALVDRFVLSTGHSAIALFATLGDLGEYSEDELETYGMDGSRIEESPLEGTPGFLITGGSLGQGLSQAVGLALGARLRRSDARVMCLLSDGELQEGQVWEAVMCAAHHRLGNLVILVDNNCMQADGATADVMGVEPVDAKLAAFGCRTARVDGNDLPAVRRALAETRAGGDRPYAFVVDTLPGKGAPSLEAYEKVHYVRARAEVWERALAEIA